MERWSVVAFGPPALAALGAALDAAKADDPLARVTVAVPSTYAGTAARRTLCAQGVGGLVNCQFVSLAWVAELLGAPALAAAGRVPLSDAVRAEAVRAALADAPGPIARAARHPRTLRSLESTLAALREMPTPLRDQLARTSPRAAVIVRLYQVTRARLRAWYDERDLFLAAAAAVRETPRETPHRPWAHVFRDVGHVVLYLPRRLSAAELDFCAALADADLLSVVLGATGDDQADQTTRALADKLAARLGPGIHAAPGAPLVADRVISAPDPEEEVRAAIREIVTRLRRDELPLYRAAILYPTPSPYAVIAAEELAAAGIPFNGPSTRTLAQTVAGRCLRGLLDLAGGDLDRRSVMAWLSDSPILERPAFQSSPTPNPRLVPATAWEHLARQAGIVRGDWSAPLKRLTAGTETDEQATRLAAFIEELSRRLDADGLGSWRQLTRWAGSLLDRYLAPAAWSQEELDAACRVRTALDGLAVLDTVAAETPDFDAFRRAVSRGLEAPVEHHGNFSTGVFVGGLADALGTDFDLVVVLGMAEGLAPPAHTTDPFLPEQHHDGRAEWRRDYLAALAAASGERVLCFPRSDPRAGRARLPSRWLLETAGHHAACTIYAEDLVTLQAPWYQRIPSFAGSLNASEPASPRDRDLCSLAAWDGNLAHHPLVVADPALARGIAAQQARAGADFSAWDGHVGPHPLLAIQNTHPVSPAELQRYAVCGMRYLLEHVLGVEETVRADTPDSTEAGETIEISPMDRGMLIHDVLGRFACGDESLEFLVEQACECFADAGAPQLWVAEQERIQSLLSRFADEDERLREELGTAPVHTQITFGDDGPPVVVALPDGGSVTLRGRLDRLDCAPDGSHAVAIDYKIGRSQPYRRALSDDPVAHGQLLALPTYGLAARAQLGDVPLRAAYWFLRDLDEFELVVLNLDEEMLRRFVEALAVIVAGIEAGRFPARRAALATSSLESCDRCPYDLVCPADRVRAWERKRQAPQLVSYVALVDPDA
jgi:ATP-dependent helicase/nuclease subunit B